MAGKRDFVRDPSSFRDRTAAVYVGDNDVVRGLSPVALRNWEQLCATRFFDEALRRGTLVNTVTAGTTGLPAVLQSEWAGYVRHERVPFISYPYEWSFSMLQDAAMLTLGLFSDALAEGMTMKDASPFNVQWFGAHPAFIDISSFEPYQPGYPWAGYRQFCQMFLFPLMLAAYRGVAFQPLLRGSIEGIPVSEMASLLSAFRDNFRRGVFLHVRLHDRLQRRYAARPDRVSKTIGNPRVFNAQSIKRTAEQLRRLVARLRFPFDESVWSGYAQSHSYDADIEKKVEFVERVLGTRSWPLVWDIGCNTGTFSRLAARYSESVVAIDADHIAVEHLYREQKKANDSKILPLVVNITDPSPGLGWRGRERRRLEERGRPALVLNLALIHHIVITANIPLAQYLDWLVSLDASIIIEFIDKEDEMTRALLSNRVDQYDDYSKDNFEDLLGARFTLHQSLTLKGGRRTLYYATPN